MSNGGLMPMGKGGAVQTGAGIETAGMVLAAQAKALVEARFLMAMHKPRSIEQARMDILTECMRPLFAGNKSALYSKPTGDGAVTGLGIRFAEMAVRRMGNIFTDSPMVYENDDFELYRVTVSDLEANVTFQADVRVNKTVERSKPHDDGTYISVRKNSRGRMTYTVRPSAEGDLESKRQALISKAIRSLSLRLIPGDIQDEAIKTIMATRLDSTAKDPHGERREMLKIFADVGISPAMVAEYLGHPVEQCDIDTLASLKATAGAIYDGEATWAQVLDAKSSATVAAKPAEAKKESPAWMSDADFDALAAKLTARLQSGAGSHDEAIAWINARGAAKSIGMVTAEQEARIRAIGPKKFDMLEFDEKLSACASLEDTEKLSEEISKTKLTQEEMDTVSDAIARRELDFIK